MTKFFSCILLIALTCVHLAGCADNSTAVVSTIYHIPVSTEFEAPDPLLQFQSAMPDAKIHQVLNCDLDANNANDCIVLYSTQGHTAGISACVSSSLFSSVDLGGDHGLIFHSTASLSSNNGVPTVSVQLKDPSTGTIYLYRVEYIYDSTTSNANYSVYSEILKGG